MFNIRKHDKYRVFLLEQYYKAKDPVDSELIT